MVQLSAFRERLLRGDLLAGEEHVALYKEYTVNVRILPVAEHFPQPGFDRHTAPHEAVAGGDANPHQERATTDGVVTLIDVRCRFAYDRS